MILIKCVNMCNYTILKKGETFKKTNKFSKTKNYREGLKNTFILLTTRFLLVRP